MIKLIAKKRFIHWLEVFFDSWLLFSDQTRKIASKRCKTVADLFILVNTTRRIETNIRQKVVITHLVIKKC